MDRMILSVAADQIQPGDMMLNQRTHEPLYQVRGVKTHPADPHYVMLVGPFDQTSDRIWRMREVLVARERALSASAW